MENDHLDLLIDPAVATLGPVSDPWTTHHNRPLCRNGQTTIGNLIDIRESAHAAYHVLFGTRTFREARRLLRRAGRIHDLTYRHPQRRERWYGRILARIGHLNNLVHLSAYHQNRYYRAYMVIFPTCWNDSKPDYEAARALLQNEYIAGLGRLPPWMNGNLVRNLELVGCDSPEDYVPVWAA